MELTQDRINEYVEWARANLRCCHECKQIEAYQVVVALADENAKLRKVADAAAEEVRRWQDEAADRLGQVAVLKEEVAKLSEIADAAARWRDAADRGDDGWHEHQATDIALKEAGR